MIGICAPYDRCEATAAALRLADLAVAQSLSVKLLGTGVLQPGIHPYWNSRVHSAKGDGAYHWAKGCKYIVWFGHYPELLKKAKLSGGEKVQHCLVVLWHLLDSHITEGLRGYDRIVCPTKAAYRQFVEAVLGDQDTKRLKHCSWDAGIEAVQRGKTCEPGKIRLYVPMDSNAIDEVGPFTVTVLDELLKANPALHVTMDCAKSWPRKVRKELVHRFQHAIGRVVSVHRSSLLQQISLLHAHDLMFMPAIRSNIGMTVLRALTCHVPVIAYDVSPFSELIQDGKNGLLVRCDVGSNWIGPIACPNLLHTLSTVGEAVEDDAWLNECRRQDWKLAKRSTAFSAFWRLEWSVC